MSRTINPELLVVAREARGITQAGLAKELAISQGNISRYEAGEREIPPFVLNKLASHLEFPVEFFTQDAEVFGFGSSFLYHRKREKLSATQLRIIHAKINMIRIQAVRLLEGVEIEADGGFRRFRIEEYGQSPERIAQLVRRAWSLPMGPVRNLIGSVENAGGMVFRCSFGTNLLDGVSQWPPDQPPMFFLNADVPVDRMRFTLAHEVGHMVMHSIPTEKIEDEANRFAAELLLPEKEIGLELANLTLQKAAALKPYWRVSMAMLVKRAFDLGKIKEWHYKDLFMQLGRLGYRKAEPNPIKPEEPTLLADIFEVYRNDHGFDVDGMAKQLRVYERDFCMNYSSPKPGFRIVG